MPGGKPIVLSGIPTDGLVAQYDLTGLDAGATSVANSVAGGPALTLVGSPTIAAGGVTFAGGTQYAVTASTVGITLAGDWTLLLVGDFRGGLSGKVVLSLGVNANDTNYHHVRAGASAGVWGFSSRNGATTNTSLTVTYPVGVSVMEFSSAGGIVAIRELGTGAFQTAANAGPTGTPRIGIGADVRQNVYNTITNTMSASYLLAYSRSLTIREKEGIYQRVVADLAAKEITLGAWMRPPLVVPVLPVNGLAPTPPMGWNSWFTFGALANMTDANMRAVTDVMVSGGLAAAGYQYVNLDDGWAEATVTDGLLTPNAKFPDMAALTSYIHAKGLKAGIYTGIGDRSCADNAGLYRNEYANFRQFADWGFDFVKLDWCSIPNPYNEDATYWYSLTTNQRYQATYGLSGLALRASGRPMVYSIGSGPLGVGSAIWGSAAGGNLWRVGTDMAATWAGINAAFDMLNGLEGYAGPGHWNDPDMLRVGQGTVTDAEGRTQMSLYAICASPLMIGGDPRTLSAASFATLTNAEVIGVNQDALGMQGKRATQAVCGDATCEVWVRQLSGGAWAVGFFNRSSTAQDVATTWAAIHAVIVEFSDQQWVARDLWAGSDLGAQAAGYTAAMLPAHGSAVLKLLAP